MADASIAGLYEALQRAFQGAPIFVTPVLRGASSCVSVHAMGSMGSTLYLGMVRTCEQHRACREALNIKQHVTLGTHKVLSQILWGQHEVPSKMLSFFRL